MRWYFWTKPARCCIDHRRLLLGGGLCASWLRHMRRIASVGVCRGRSAPIPLSNQQPRQPPSLALRLCLSHSTPSMSRLPNRIDVRTCRGGGHGRCLCRHAAPADRCCPRTGTGNGEQRSRRQHRCGDTRWLGGGVQPAGAVRSRKQCE